MADTITVASKLPNGLHLDLQTVIGNDPARGDIVKRDRFATLKGAELPRGTDHKNDVTYQNVVGGFALTPGVDKAKFEAWLKQNAEMPAVKNGLIFAHASGNSARAEATEKAALKHGFEPVDPAAPAPKVQTLAA